MIRLTRINHKPLVLNSDLIEHIEVTPDTVISMTTGQKFVVLESADEVVNEVIRFRKSVCSDLTLYPSVASTATARSASLTHDESSQ